MMASIVVSCERSISASASISASLVLVFRFASRYSPSDRWSEARVVLSIIELGIGDWGLGIGDWGLRIILNPNRQPQHRRYLQRQPESQIAPDVNRRSLEDVFTIRNLRSAIRNQIICRVQL